MNFVNFTGILGKDAAVRKAGNGEFLSLRVALEKVTSGNGKFQEKTVWVNVISNRPEEVKNAKYLKKGVRISVIGKLKTDKEGNLYIKADAVGLLFKKEKKQKEQAPAPEPEEDTPEEIPEGIDEPPF